MKVLAYGILAALAVAGPLSAQDVVGSAIVDGRKAQLFDDGTWRFESAGEADCTTLAKRLEFCGLDVWGVTSAANPDAVATYRADDRHYAQFIVESLGRRDGLTSDNVRAAIMQMTSVQIGSDVTVVETSAVTVDGQEGETIVYLVPFAGIDNVFANTIVIGEDFLLQAQTWQVGPLPFSDRHRELHADLLDATRIPSGN